MKDGICPKCKSTEVYCGASTEGEGLTAGSYNSLVEILANKTPMTLWINTYICSACGYLEMHVANMDALALLVDADGWLRVSPVISPER